MFMQTCIHKHTCTQTPAYYHKTHTRMHTYIYIQKSPCIHDGLEISHDENDALSKSCIAEGLTFDQIDMARMGRRSVPQTCHGCGAHVDQVVSVCSREYVTCVCFYTCGCMYTCCVVCVCVFMTVRSFVFSINFKCMCTYS